MHRSIIAALTIEALLATATARAASVANLDPEPRTVTVEEGESKQDHVVAPGAVLDGVCLKGCFIRIRPDGGDHYMLEGSEATSIENGQLWDDDRGSPADAPDSDAGPSASPSPRP
jgi:hypothetical protein